MNRLLIFVVTFLLLPFLVEAQDRYAVFYKYKPQDGLNLDQPQDFLTDRALLRRAKEGVAVDSSDLPVTQRYIDEVYQRSHYILYQSKWLNASLIVTDMEGAKSIAELPFVEKVELVGKGYIPNPNARIRPGIRVTATESVPSRRKS